MRPAPVIAVPVVLAVLAVLAALGGCSSDAPGCTAQEEVCDGADNDCDGAVDEWCECAREQTRPCYRGPPETRGIGVCQQDGFQDCFTGFWSECMGGSFPSAEVCDGADNDCDGQADEDFPPPQIVGCGAAPSLGQISGDAVSDDPHAVTTITRTGWHDQWFQILVREDKREFLTETDLGVRLVLGGDATHRYDLVVRCASCADAEVASYWWPLWHERELPLSVEDTVGDDDTLLLVHVKHLEGPTCPGDVWTLTVSTRRGPSVPGWKVCR